MQTIRRIVADAVVIAVLAVGGLYLAAAVGASRTADVGYEHGSRGTFVAGAGPAGHPAR
jgi:hypothetical protein